MNVIGSRPDGWWRDRSGAMRRLVAALDRVAERRGGDWIVVFDGRRRDVGGVRVAVEWASRRGRDAADDRIVELVAAAAGERIVYTSDRRLQARVAVLGAAVRTAGRIHDLIDRSAP